MKRKFLGSQEQRDELAALKEQVADQEKLIASTRGLKDWLLDYYPVPASKARTMTDREALDHSIRKWSGLSEEILNKYKLFHSGGDLYPYPDDNPGGDAQESFGIDSDSCALCVKHLKQRDPCSTCPLSIVRDGYSCESTIREDGVAWEAQSPFHYFIVDGNPEPMLKLLRKARKHVVKQMKEQKANESA